MHCKAHAIGEVHSFHGNERYYIRGADSGMLTRVPPQVDARHRLLDRIDWPSGKAWPGASPG